MSAAPIPMRCCWREAASCTRSRGRWRRTQPAALWGLLQNQLTFGCTNIHINRMLLTVAAFDWDAGNRDKRQKHGLSIAVIESLFGSPIAVFPDPAHSEREERFKAIGRAENGRGVL